MKGRLILAAMLLVLTQSLRAGWMRGFGKEGWAEIGYCVRQTNDGGYIIVGRSRNCDLDGEWWNGEIWLIRTDEKGDTLWTRTYGSEVMDEGRCVQPTKDGGYIILGFANFPPPTEWPAGDIWLLKTDAEGDTIWTRLYRGYSLVSGGWVEQTSDSGYILTSNWDNAYLLLLKTDKDGNTEWSKNYQWGSGQIETGYCVHQTKDGGYIVATNMGLFKTDENGDSVWLKPWIGREVEPTTDGGYFVPTSKDGDAWLIKTDNQGDTLWTRTYGGDGTEWGRSAQQTEDGGYIILGGKPVYTWPTGTVTNGIWLIKTDEHGDTVWTRTFGGKDDHHSGNFIQQTYDSGYIIAGVTAFLGDDFGDVLLIKTDSLGYVGVAEPPVPVTHEPDWEVVTSVGRTITLRYENRPQGFHATVYDATGRKVENISSASQSATITWGEGHQVGVYFIKPISRSLATARKVVLVK